MDSFAGTGPDHVEKLCLEKEVIILMRGLLRPFVGGHDSINVKTCNKFGKTLFWV